MERKKFIVCILASGNGTNAEAIMSYFAGHPAIQVGMLLSNNAQAMALTRAANYNIPALSFNKEQFRESDEVLQLIREAGTTHIVLAGFLWLVPHNLLKAFPDMIVNIHPSLLPKFGGKGMYGDNVHQAVKLAGEIETGITIHLVNEHFDEGRVLFQTRCPINLNDSPQQIAQRVHELEYKYYPKTIEKWILGN